jgi:hypothetical protein
MFGTWEVRGWVEPGFMPGRAKMLTSLFSLLLGPAFVPKMILLASNKHPGNTWKSLGLGKEGLEAS